MKVRFVSQAAANIRCNVLVIAASLVAILQGHSQGVTYTDRTSFNAILQSSRTIDFESIPPYDGIGTGQSPILILSPPPVSLILTVTNFEHRLFVAGGSSPLNPTPGTGQYIWNFDSSYPISIFFPSGRNAFGADFSGGIAQNNPFNATLTFTLLSGQTHTHNFTGQMGQWTFRGFVFPETITSVIYSDGGPFLPGGHEEMLDNVTYGIATVPEPQVALLSASAVIFWLAARRRCR